MQVTAEQYTEFYKSTFKAFDKPLTLSHFSLEGQVNTCMCAVYVQTYTYILTDHTYIHAYRSCIHNCKCIHTYIHTYIHKRKCICVHMSYLMYSHVISTRKDHSLVSPQVKTLLTNLFTCGTLQALHTSQKPNALRSEPKEQKVTAVKPHTSLPGLLMMVHERFALQYYSHTRSFRTLIFVWEFLGLFRVLISV